MRTDESTRDECFADTREKAKVNSCTASAARGVATVFVCPVVAGMTAAITALTIFVVLFGIIVTAPHVAAAQTHPDDIYWDTRFDALGANSRVEAIAIDGSNVYIGGEFTQVGSLPANYVARWDGSQWHALGGGPGCYANRLFVHDGILYAACRRWWDGETWHTMGTPLTGSPCSPSTWDIAYFKGCVYYAGTFQKAGDKYVRGIARWDGAQWHDLDGGLFVDAPGGYACAGGIESDGEYLWVAGNFDRAGDIVSRGVAKWDGENWHAVPSPFSGGITVWSSALVDGKWYVAGLLVVDADDGFGRNIAMFDGSQWHAMQGGTNDMVLDVCAVGSEAYICGLFTKAGGIDAPHIARWDGSSWTSLGSGLARSPGGGMTWLGWVFAVAANEAGEVWVGGDHTYAGAVRSNRIARWYDPVPFPSNGVPFPRTVGQDVDAALSWGTAGHPSDGLSYDVYFGTQSDPPLMLADYESTGVDLDSLDFATRYNWRVVAKNASGDHAYGPPWWFETQDFTTSRLVVSSAATSCAMETGDTVMIDLVIEDNPTPVFSGGVDLKYDPDMLTPLFCEPGPLTALWQHFDYADLDTAVRIGGFNHDPIPAGSTGVFARVGFQSHCCDRESRTVTLTAVNLMDDLAPLRPIRGEYACDATAPTGDANGDGQVTVSDAFCAFQAYMFLPETVPIGCPIGVSLERIDVNCNALITPEDALCIFRESFDGSCAFCDEPSGILASLSGASDGNGRVKRGTSGTPSAVGLQTPRRTEGPSVFVPEIIVDGENIMVPVKLSGQPALDAFGFEVTYPADAIEFVGTDWPPSMGDFEETAVRELGANRLRLGGYSPVAVDATAIDFVNLRFRALGAAPGGAIVIGGFLDDLSGAQTVEVVVGIGPEPPRYTRYVLDQNRPNPFNPTTRIHYEVPTNALGERVTLAVYDVTGSLVRVLVNGPVDGGPHDVYWDARNERGNRVSSGVYFCVMRSGSNQLTRRMVVLR